MDNLEKPVQKIPDEYFEEPGILNSKGLAKYKSNGDMVIIGKQIEIEEPEPRRID